MVNVVDLMASMTADKEKRDKLSKLNAQSFNKMKQQMRKTQARYDPGSASYRQVEMNIRYLPPSLPSPPFPSSRIHTVPVLTVCLRAFV